MEGVVLMTEDLFPDADEPDAKFRPEDVLPEEILPDACARLAEDLPVELLFLLTVLLDPIPPLSEVPLANTLSEPVWCLEPYHTSL